LKSTTHAYQHNAHEVVNMAHTLGSSVLLDNTRVRQS